jgi:hypothetical protein
VLQEYYAAVAQYMAEGGDGGPQQHYGGGGGGGGGGRGMYDGRPGTACLTLGLWRSTQDRNAKEPLAAVQCWLLQCCRQASTDVQECWAHRQKTSDEV